MIAYDEINTIIETAANNHMVPLDIAKGVAWQESCWNPIALSFDGGHGKGLFQIDDRFHSFANTPEVWYPINNADYGCKMLHDLHQDYGSWPEAIQHYNGSGDQSKLYAWNVWLWSQIQPWKKHLGSV